jgi:ribosomal protein S18 acetylase RimI-like enzyme
MPIEIVPAETRERVEAARRLIRAYAEWLERDHGVSLAFQGVAEELATLPGRYAPPEGALLLALAAGGRAVGMVALRPLGPGTCEIKRLYVLPEARGTGLGGRLAAAIVAEARRLGYTRAVLDTGGFMAGAQRLYEALGFRETAPYYDNPYPGMRFMACDLAPDDA